MRQVWFSPVFSSEIRTRSFRILWIRFCLWFWLEIWNWTSDSSSSPVRNLWNSFFLLLNFVPLWSYWVRRFRWWIQCSNCRGLAQGWRFVIESLRAAMDSMDLVLNLLLKTVRVCEIVFQFSEFVVILI